MESLSVFRFQALCVSTSSVPENWFVNGNASHLEPAFNPMKNGMRTGTITAVDLKTGKTKWVYPTEFPNNEFKYRTSVLSWLGDNTEIRQ